MSVLIKMGLLVTYNLRCDVNGPESIYKSCPICFLLWLLLLLALLYLSNYSLFSLTFNAMDCFL